jgi:hypothetical protein
MATGFSGLGLGELGAESKYIGKANTYYRPTVTKNAKGEPQYDLLGRALNGLEDMASKYAGDKLTPALNWLQNKLVPAVPPGTTPMAVSPIAPASSVAPGSIATAPIDVNADHPELEGLLKTDPFNP